MTDLTKEYFSDGELRCKCGCGQLIFDQNVRQKLNVLRESFGKPMVVSSGYRCPQHPLEVNKNKPGEHTTGMCVDIAVSGVDVIELTSLAYEMGVRRIGWHQKAEGRFVHLGFNPDFPEGSWTY